MSKSSHITRQPVYCQVLKLLDKAEIIRISRSTGSSKRYVKRPDGYTHLAVMQFGVLKHFDSLREPDIGLKAETNKLNHPGIDDYPVRRSTLGEANQRRSQEFLCKIYKSLLKRYSPFLADSRARGEAKQREQALYMMDSTTITL